MRMNKVTGVEEAYNPEDQDRPEDGFIFEIEDVG
jgi:hypothetical protein